MASKRMIQSDIFEDDWFGGLTNFEGLLWIGLFAALADDQGRLLDNARLALSRLFPFRDDVSEREVKAALDHFATDGKLLRYEAKNKKLIQVLSWWKQQQPQWAAPSKFPSPPDWTDHVRLHGKDGYVSENWPPPEHGQRAKKETVPQESQVDGPPGPPTLPLHLDEPPGESTLSPQVEGQIKAMGSGGPIEYEKSMKSKREAHGPDGVPDGTRPRDHFINLYKQADNANKIKVLSRVHELLFAEKANYGRLGKLHAQVKPGGHLIDLMFQAAGRELIGDPMDYLTKMALQGQPGPKSLPSIGPRLRPDFGAVDDDEDYA